MFVTQSWKLSNCKLRQQHEREEKKISGSKIVTPGPQTTKPKAAGKCPKPEEPPKALQWGGSLTGEELTMIAHLLQDCTNKHFPGMNPFNAHNRQRN